MALLTGPGCLLFTICIRQAQSLSIKFESSVFILIGRARNAAADTELGWFGPSPTSAPTVGGDPASNCNAVCDCDTSKGYAKYYSIADDSGPWCVPPAQQCVFPTLCEIRQGQVVPTSRCTCCCVQLHTLENAGVHNTLDTILQCFFCGCSFEKLPYTFAPTPGYAGRRASGLRTTGSSTYSSRTSPRHHEEYSTALPHAVRVNTLTAHFLPSPPFIVQATTNTPCADAGYTVYNSTATHGGGGLYCTLDLYSCDEGLESGACPHPAETHNIFG